MISVLLDHITISFVVLSAIGGFMQRLTFWMAADLLTVKLSNNIIRDHIYSLFSFNFEYHEKEHSAENF